MKMNSAFLGVHQYEVSEGAANVEAKTVTLYLRGHTDPAASFRLIQGSA
jgi:hypothetical protein